MGDDVCGEIKLIRIVNFMKKWYDLVFFFREFQPMASAPDDTSLLLDQDTNQFFV